MTREILFRGKHKDNGEWLIGYFIDWNTESKVSIISPDEPHICNDVISETVGQYTGLTDKSGM